MESWADYRVREGTMRHSEDAHEPSAPPPITLVGRPDRKATAQLLRPWVEATRLTAPQTDIWVDTLLEQGRELMDEVIRQDNALYDAYDRIEELADEALQERDKARDYRTLLIVLLVALALLWGTRGL